MRQYYYSKLALTILKKNSQPEHRPSIFAAMMTVEIAAKGFRRMNKSIAYCLVGCLAQFPLNSIGQITGPMRAEFLQGAEASCFRTQRSANANNNASDRTIGQYCRCFSVYLADSLNNALAVSIYEGEQKFNAELIAMGYRFCIKNLHKY